MRPWPDMFPSYETGLYSLSCIKLLGNRLRWIDKRAYYAMMYGSNKPTQERIDEEGCGAVFAAACLPLPGQLYGNQN